MGGSSPQQSSSPRTSSSSSSSSSNNSSSSCQTVVFISQTALSIHTEAGRLLREVKAGARRAATHHPLQKRRTKQAARYIAATAYQPLHASHHHHHQPKADSVLLLLQRVRLGCCTRGGGDQGEVCTAAHCCTASCPAVCPSDEHGHHPPTILDTVASLSSARPGPGIFSSSSHY